MKYINIPIEEMEPEQLELYLYEIKHGVEI